jgi:tetratricopeptide (TPR) repeat protein
MKRLLACVLLVATVGCGSRAAGPSAKSPASRPAARTIELEPLRIDVVQSDGKTETRMYDARSLLDEGNDALMQRKYDQALAAYRHLVDDFPDSRLVVPALYNSGIAFEGKQDWEAAIERYRKILDLNPAGNPEDVLSSHFRLGAVLAELRRFPESIAVFEKVLARDDLKPADRIEAIARLGFALVETKDYPGGEEVLRSGLAYYQQIQGTTRLDNLYFVAMAQYYLAQSAHQQFNAVPLRYPEQQMLRDTDQKSELFMLARDRYIKTVEIKQPFWATAAVYQIANMYKDFWDAWMAVPIPADFNEAEQKEYIKQVNEQATLRKLLEKALIYHERNIAMAKQAGVSTAWTEQSEKDAETIRQLISRQQRKDYLVPGKPPAAPSAPSGPIAPIAPIAPTAPTAPTGRDNPPSPGSPRTSPDSPASAPAISLPDRVAP